MISETLIKISNEYLEQKNTAFENNELASFKLLNVFVRFFLWILICTWYLPLRFLIDVIFPPVCVTGV